MTKTTPYWGRWVMWSRKWWLIAEDNFVWSENMFCILYAIHNFWDFWSIKVPGRDHPCKNILSFIFTSHVLSVTSKMNFGRNCHFRNHATLPKIPKNMQRCLFSPCNDSLHLRKDQALHICGIFCINAEMTFIKMERMCNRASEQGREAEI